MQSSVCLEGRQVLLHQSHLAGGMTLLSWGDSGAACTMALQPPNPRLGSLIRSWNELNVQFHMIPGTQEGKDQHLLLNWTFKSGHAAQPALASSRHVQARLSYEVVWKTKRRAEQVGRSWAVTYRTAAVAVTHTVKCNVTVATSACNSTRHIQKQVLWALQSFFIILTLSVRKLWLCD